MCPGQQLAGQIVINTESAAPIAQMAMAPSIPISEAGFRATTNQVRVHALMDERAHGTACMSASATLAVDHVVLSLIHETHGHLSGS